MMAFNYGPRPHLVAALALLLSACATPAPRIEVREVKIPVAVSCATDPGPDPVYPDSDEALKAASDLFERVKLILAGRVMRIAREAELKAAMKGCSA